MESKNRSLRKITDKLYGGLPMSWAAVILLAVASAVITAVFLILPVFRNTSFERMGVYFEAWIFFAVLIMANCKKPLESALKVFVFFLISQPLIYLFQVPFSAMGWGLFRYYRTWFIWTLLTLPMAYVGWHIRRKDWLSLLILAPVLCFLTSIYVSSFRFAFVHFPRRLFTAIFCLAQVLAYLYAFTANRRQKLLGFALPLAVMLGILLAKPQIDLNSTLFLPDDPVLTESATVELEGDAAAEVSIESTGEGSIIRVRSRRYGTTLFAIHDGAQTYRYTMEIYEDDGGHSQIRITPRE